MNQNTEPTQPGGVAYWRTLARQRDGELQRLRDELIEACNQAENAKANADIDEGFDILDELLMKLRRLVFRGGQS